MLWSTIAATVALAVVALVPGVPLALLALRRVETSASVVWTTAIGLGIGAWMVLGVPAVHHGRFDLPSLGIAGTALTAAAWVPARHHVAALRPGRPSWLSAVLAALALPALWLRDDPIYFAYQVADFGEYVNRANFLADGGRFGAFFVNGFPLLLGESSLLLGEARTPAIMPLLGLFVVGGILAVVQLALPGDARPRRIVVAGVAVLLTVQVHAVWFAQFPASETAYAALLVLSVLLGVAALAGRDPRVAIAAGVVGVLLVVTRGNGLVYVPVVALALSLAPVFTDATRVGIVRRYFAATAAGLWLGSLYDARFNPLYFLDAQSEQRLPSFVAERFTRIDEVPWAVAFTVLVALGLGAAWAVSVVVERVAGSGSGLGVLRRGTFVVVALGVAAAHGLVLSRISWQPRYEALGVVLWGAPFAALAVWWWRARDDLDGVTRFALGWPLLTALALGTFQASRMKKSVTVDSQWFLYWDRYFFSELLPMLVVAGAVAAGVVLAAAARRPGSTWHRATLGIAVVIVAAGLLDTAAPTARAVEQPMFADAYDELAAIDALLVEDLPVVYDGFDDPPSGWFWSNSSRVLANPLWETFGNRVVNPAPPTGRDPQPTESELRAILDEIDAPDAYLLQVNGQPSWDQPWGGVVSGEVVGTTMLTIERLDGRSRVRPEDQAWILSDLHIRVVRISRTGLAA